MADTAPTAAMLAIGDEILSGRTKDKNIGHLAETLTLAGIDLCEVRIVPDTIATIAEALNHLRETHDFVFTSGGIGPTHDDVTADAVGEAFGRPVDEHPEALERLGTYYDGRGVEFTPARRRMARTPEGASLIDNPVSVAPGFRVDNVFVMAGVPQVFQAMLSAVIDTLPHGRTIESRTLPCPFGEGDVGGPLRDVAKAHPEVAIGSYPKFVGETYRTEIVLRSREIALLDAAEADVAAMLERMAADRPRD